MENNNNNVNIIPEENRNKSGIYRWNNLITGNSYVGSAVNLANRLKKYFSPIFLKKEILKYRSKINKELVT